MAEADDAAASTTGSGDAVAIPATTPGMPVLHLGSYEGPLDLLLELARAQRVDIARISVLDLAGQFVAAVEAAIAGQRVPLGQIGAWLVAVATLLALRARLLLPTDTPENREAAREAAALRRQLADRAAVQRLADWLERRPQLGHEVFGRGLFLDVEESGPPVTDITALLRACLRLLELPARELVYRPPLPPLWRVATALAHLRLLLPVMPHSGVALGQLVPTPEQAGSSPLQRRAALASTLLAGLELAREGALGLNQEEGFGEIRAWDPAHHPSSVTSETGESAPAAGRMA